VSENEEIQQAAVTFFPNQYRKRLKSQPIKKSYPQLPTKSDYYRRTSPQFIRSNVRSYWKELYLNYGVELLVLIIFCVMLYVSLLW
jgi:hypothetical protein